MKVPSREYGAEKDLVIKVFSEGQMQGDPDVYISRVSHKLKLNNIDEQEA